MHKIWPGRRAHWVKYKNINNSDLDGMSLASFCQSRAELSQVGSCPRTPFVKQGIFLCQHIMMFICLCVRVYLHFPLCHYSYRF